MVATVKESNGGKLSDLRMEIMDRFYLGDVEDPLRSKHSKLCYQRNILATACADSERALSSKSIDVMACIKYLLSMAYTKLGFADEGGSHPSLQVHSKDCDYLCSDPFKIFKNVKRDSAAGVAGEIISALPPNRIIESAEVVKNGFILLKINHEFASNFVAGLILNENVNDKRGNPVCPPGFNSRRVLVDFSSPNIAKEMHVGHLRSTIIGDCLCRLYEYLGCEVHRINHVGDWGTQFGMLIAYFEHKFGTLTPETNSISDLQQFYKESKILFDQDDDFKSTSHKMVVRLQSKDPAVISAWKSICDVSRKEFDRIYQRLDIELTEVGESFYHDLMGDVVRELESLKLMTVENNCKLMLMKELGLPPLFVVKSDGGYTYDTSDLAAIRMRLQKVKVDSCLYVVDNGQADHFRAIFHAASLAGWCLNSDGRNAYPRVEHVGFGVVLGEDKKKFKTRSGDTVKLSSLLDEGVERARAKIMSKSPPVDWPEHEVKSTSEAVAYSCIRYSDLSRHRVSDYVFSYDRMLEDRGNTAVYLLYASTRIKSILRRSSITSHQVKEYVRDRVNAGHDSPILLEHSTELTLAKKLMNYPAVLKRVEAELLPHYLCDYLYELATRFMEFYESCYCFKINSTTGEITSVDMNRIALVYATQNVLRSGFLILGIHTTVERM